MNAGVECGDIVGLAARDRCHDRNGDDRNHHNCSYQPRDTSCCTTPHSVIIQVITADVNLPAARCRRLATERAVCVRASKEV